MIKRTLSVLSAASIGVIALACANHPPLLDRLSSQRETDRFMTCIRPVFHELCPGEQINHRPCVDALAGEYIAQPTEHDRQRWLEGKGCPRDVTGYVPTSEENYGHVASSVDEFTRTRTIEYHGQVGGRIRTTFVGSESFAFLMLSSHGGEWRYLSCHQVDMLVNGTPVPLAPSEHRGTVHGGGVGESVTVDLTPEALQALQFAQTIRFRVCADTFTFEPGAIIRIRDFASQTRALAVARGPVPQQ